MVIHDHPRVFAHDHPVPFLIPFLIPFLYSLGAVENVEAGAAPAFYCLKWRPEDGRVKVPAGAGNRF
jgi:hypothetical protein